MLLRNKQLKQLMKQIQDDWNSLKDRLEIDILEKYARNLKLFTISIMVLCYISLFIFGIFQRSPLIFDAILPLNESRSYQLLVMTEYFVNQDKFIHVMLLHEFLAFYIALSTVFGTGLTILIYILHLCVLLKITSYRIKNAVKRNILAIPSPKREHLLHQRIAHAIFIHQRTIEYHKFFMSIFMIPFGFLVIAGVCSITFTFFLIFQLLISNNKSMCYIAAGLVLMYLCYLFVGNFCGQLVIDNGINLLEATYNGLWYAAPLSTQRLLLFIMQRGKIPLDLSYYGMLIASLDGFATLMKTAVSYFMVLHSTQK